ncbi:MAG: YkgJ family cysteine cluster protein [Gammaproteobacteria bacterium]|nr:YkgJ family cysteine cluster protein [Gammaproteobacteria bacterium]
MKACNQCGKCCIAYSDGGLSASTAEIDWWEDFRPEIHKYVSQGKIWTSPTTGEQLVHCPWLHKIPNQNKYGCTIYHDRPDDCRHYPVDIQQMIKDNCEMLEPRDLTNQSKAQKKLDILMSESRPPILG